MPFLTHGFEQVNWRLTHHVTAGDSLVITYDRAG
jgi:hypothetical protein